MLTNPPVQFRYLLRGDPLGGPLTRGAQDLEDAILTYRAALRSGKRHALRPMRGTMEYRLLDARGHYGEWLKAVI